MLTLAARLLALSAVTAAPLQAQQKNAAQA
jgi:hypothetical protein